MAGSETRCPSDVPELRVRGLNDRPPRGDGRFVLYWMTAFRRTRWNFALDRAIEWARAMNRPLAVLETLPGGVRWASDRHHAFVLAGMAEHAEELAARDVSYYPYVETRKGEALRLAVELGGQACAVVTDDFPMRQVAEAAAEAAGRIQVRMEAVDSNGLLPMRAAPQAYPSAFTFRRFLQKTLPDHLLDVPKTLPLSRLKLPRLKSLPREFTDRWPGASKKLLAGETSGLAELPIDHGVAPSEIPGGPAAARDALRRFLDGPLARYAEDRNHPDDDATSGFSPYLHHGQLSVHEVFHEIARKEDWSPDRLAEKAGGKREGWWGMSETAEAFLDELITWREVGFNMTAKRDDYDRYESLPDWARKTLSEHAGDPREHVYSLGEFESAGTHDPLWNAAQTQLVREGRLHNYLRMLWGKKILHWTASPQEALEVMIELNNKYALDGCDPNSYSGIFWVLGRYDRPWGPERPIFGKVRYMTSDNTARKLRVRRYLDKYRP